MGPVAEAEFIGSVKAPEDPRLQMFKFEGKPWFTFANSQATAVGSKKSATWFMCMNGKPADLSKSTTLGSHLGCETGW